MSTTSSSPECFTWRSFVRCAHARITGVDLSAARTAIGVRLAPAGAPPIHPPHFDRIEIEMSGSSLDDPFGDVGGLRPYPR